MSCCGGCGGENHQEKKKQDQELAQEKNAEKTESTEQE